MKNYLKELNKKQKEAVTSTEGPVLVIAGAGAGKTKTITHRIAYLIDKGIHPEKILAVTFTNKAASEMHDRVEKLLKGKPSQADYFYRPAISTFHSLGVKIIRENAKKLGLKKHFTILDKNDSISIIKKIMKQKGIDIKEYEPKKIISFISKQKSKGVTYTEFLNEEYSNYFINIVKDVWEQYEKIKQESSALDFDDLLLKTLFLLKNNKDILEKYQNKWSYIHIDEYQDTNLVQYKIIRLLVGKKENIFVVGDVDQAIYSWRGADFTNVLNFEKDFPKAKIIILEENYRSTQTIISVSNEIISKNVNRREKKLFTKNNAGEKITLHIALDEGQEASFVAEEAHRLIKTGVKPEEIAVLYRTNFLSRVLEEAFLERRIPYQVLGTRFFERREIKDMIAYIKASLDKNDLTSIERIINTPKRGIGKVTMAKLVSGKYKDLSSNVKTKVDNFYKLLSEIKENIYNIPLSDTFRFILKKTGLEDKLLNGSEDDIERLENIYELIAISAKYNNLEPEDRIQTFLDDVALMTSEQDQIKKDGGVKLMTVHASKGLEFSHVFIVGLEEGLFPHREIEGSKKDPEEERRLFYVAITRAKQKLYLSYSNTRVVYGREQINIPSEFLIDIKDEYLEESDSREQIISI